jgi:PPK2 family polyphosphate:nucleotide phosphotransferase
MSMDFCQRYRVQPGSKVKLGDWDPSDTLAYRHKKDVRSAVKKNLDRLRELQHLLYAESKRSVLVVLQAMDAGGKDGTIRHVMGPLNPQGVKVTSFKAPTDEELAHDFLWRVHKATPARGEIAIFNRSHYEDVLIVRVRSLVPRKVWAKRYALINTFEKLLAVSGTHIVKFYLHISPDEQLERLRARFEDPTKHWKANPGDFEARRDWDAYAEAFETALSKCSKPHAPWYVVPANRKWFRNLVVSSILVETLESLDMSFPPPSFDPAEIDLEKLIRESS